MQIFSKKKSKINQSLKKTLQDWLGKVVNPETDSKHKTRVQKKNKTHVHCIEGETARAKGHKEQFSLNTGKTIATNDGHIHEYDGAIMANAKTTHRIEGVTGPAIEQGTDHYHKVTGCTTLDDQHVHKYAIHTSYVVSHKKKRLRQPITRRYAAVITPVTEKYEALPVEEE